METNYEKAIKAFEKMDKSERRSTLFVLLDRGIIDISEAVAVYGSHLERFKEDAKHDINRVATAGIDLSEKQIKAIPKMKNKRQRDVATAQAVTLLSTRVYEGTPFEKELYKCVDMEGIDEDWYEWSWKLRTVSTPELSSKEKD